MRTATICYLAVAGLLFIIGLVIGKVYKKDILHGKVMLGVLNSALIASVWPLAIFLCTVGWLYDAVQAWKKL